MVDIITTNLSEANRLWSRISRHFTNDLVTKWTTAGFDVNSCAEWLRISGGQDDYREEIQRVDWFKYLRDAKKLTPITYLTTKFDFKSILNEYNFVAQNWTALVAKQTQLTTDVANLGKIITKTKEQQEELDNKTSELNYLNPFLEKGTGTYSGDAGSPVPIETAPITSGKFKAKAVLAGVSDSNEIKEVLKKFNPVEDGDYKLLIDNLTPIDDISPERYHLDKWATDKVISDAEKDAIKEHLLSSWKHLTEYYYWATGSWETYKDATDGGKIKQKWVSGVKAFTDKAYLLSIYQIKELLNKIAFEEEKAEYIANVKNPAKVEYNQVEIPQMATFPVYPYNYLTKPALAYSKIGYLDNFKLKNSQPMSQIFANLGNQ